VVVPPSLAIDVREERVTLGDSDQRRLMAAADDHQFDPGRVGTPRTS